MMKDNRQKWGRFQARRKTIETSIDGFFEALKTIPAASDTSDGGLGMFRNFPSIQRLAYRAQREQLNFTTLQHEENKELRKEAIRVDKAQFNVNVAGFLSILLNSSVVITMIIYFIRNKRLQRLAEAKLANKPKEGIPETGEGLENLLHELAGALSEAEHREKMLLSKLQTQSGQEAVPIRTSSEAALQAAKADDLKQVITERASISNNKDSE